MPPMRIRYLMESSPCRTSLAVLGFVVLGLCLRRFVRKGYFRFVNPHEGVLKELLYVFLKPFELDFRIAVCVIKHVTNCYCEHGIQVAYGGKFSFEAKLNVNLDPIGTLIHGYFILHE